MTTLSIGQRSVEESQRSTGAGASGKRCFSGTSCWRTVSRFSPPTPKRPCSRRSPGLPETWLPDSSSNSRLSAQRAIRLTPLFPPLFPAVLATGHYLCQQADEAVDAARGAIELSPENLENHVVLAGALAAAGHPDQAASALQEIHRLKKDFSLDEFATSQPFKDPADLDRMLGDLRAAGLT